ncbi:MAG: hypothetical protein JST98_08995, partial [Bacteroidetes bacterium]|nr:hypothetical protein [Bacteroidota bacterium]
DRAYVEASTNGSTWTTLQTYSSTQGSATGFAQVTVNLGSYLNQATVYVRFRYAATWDYYWAIDNVTVSGTTTPSFAWSSTPAGFTSNQQNPANVAVTQNTVYTVTATSPNGCTTSASTGTVSFVQAPAATIAYGGSPYCANAGSIAVTRTGTAGGTYTAPGGLSINASTGAVNAGASTPGTYTVTYTVPPASPCGQFQTTASITINAAPSATISYTGSPYCNSGTASVTRTGTAGGTYTAPGGLSINASTGTIDLGASTPGTYTVTYTIAASGGCAAFNATASITINAAPSATISYTGSPYCNSGTATVSRTGTAGGTYTAPGGLSINASTGAVNAGTSTPGTYTVTYTIAASGGCAAYSTTGGITIDALPTTAAAGSAQSVCLGGSATLAANAALSGTGAWSVASGPSLNTSQFSNTADRTATFLPDGGAGVYTLRWTISHGACTPSTSDVAITITDCAYYSQSSGTFADPIWATAPVGTPGPATFSASTSMVVQGGHTVTGTANADVRQLTVQAGGTLALNAGTTLTVNGDAATFNGTVNAADNST